MLGSNWVKGWDGSRFGRREKGEKWGRERVKCYVYQHDNKPRLSTVLGFTFRHTLCRQAQEIKFEKLIEYVHS